MDPYNFKARAEAQRWLGIAEKLLIGHDLVGSKSFAIRARESDPRLETPHQILTIIDTLLAAEKLVVGNNGTYYTDFYAILQVVPFVQDTEHIASQYRRLAVMLNPDKNRFPYSDQAFQLVNEAWDMLSNPFRKSMYDAELEQQINHIGFDHHQQREHVQPFQHQTWPPSQPLEPQQSMLPSMASPSVTPPPTPMSWLHAPSTSLPQLQSLEQQSTPTSLLQPPVHWPQLKEKQHELYEESFKQDTNQVQLPGDVNSNNGARDEETQSQTEENSENVINESPTFWTACPYCLYMYEYPRVYTECTLRCDNCKRAFQAVPILSPPSIIEGQEACFYCWGFFPIGVSISHLERNNGNWTPFSPFYASPKPDNLKANPEPNHSNADLEHLNGRRAKKNKIRGPHIYIDDVTDDIFMNISEPSDDSDVEWGSTKKKKVKRTKDAINRMAENSILAQEGVGAPTVPLADSCKKTVASSPRKQSGQVAKELRKLESNMEFNSSEGEEPATQMAAGNREHGQGEEDNIGFFEELDEFVGSFPIPSVVNDEKVKAALW